MVVRSSPYMENHVFGPAAGIAEAFMKYLSRSDIFRIVEVMESPYHCSGVKSAELNALRKIWPATIEDAKRSCEPPPP